MITAGTQRQGERGAPWGALRRGFSNLRHPTSASTPAYRLLPGSSLQPSCSLPHECNAWRTDPDGFLSVGTAAMICLLGAWSHASGAADPRPCQNEAMALGHVPNSPSPEGEACPWSPGEQTKHGLHHKKENRLTPRRPGADSLSGTAPGKPGNQALILFLDPRACPIQFEPDATRGGSLHGVQGNGIT